MIEDKSVHKLLKKSEAHLQAFYPARKCAVLYDILILTKR